MTSRPGAALLEVVVALPLSALAAALAVQLFVAQVRVVERQAERFQARRALAQAAAALAADLRPLSARDLEAWSDSSITAWAPILIGVACGTPAPDIIDVTTGNPTSLLRAVASVEPRPGDRLAWSVPDTAVVGGPADTLAPVGTLREAGWDSRACLASPLRGAATPRRLRVAPGAFALPEAGSVLVVQRRVEWRAYRASDGDTWLGRRDWTGATWTTIQPVAGPLHPHRDGGFAVTVLDASGRITSAGDTDAALVRIALRAPRRAPRSPLAGDSLVLLLGLRGGR